jgi:tetratricopeptide (TPR) repeat protein
VALFGKGIALQLLPVGQSPDYSYPAIPLAASPLDPRVLVALALVAAWLGAGLAVRRRAPVVLWSFAWYAVALLPGSNLLFPIGTLFGERLLYLPSVGLALLAGAGAAAVAPRLPRGAGVAAGGAVLAALTVATLRYSEAWADEASLFRHAEVTQPRSAKVHHKLAIVDLERAPERALAEIDRSIALYDGEPQAHLIRADALRRLGRPGEEAEVRRALALEPRTAPGNYAMGRIAREAGRLDEAAEWWRRALAADPAHAAALADLATYHLFRGDTAVAFGLATRAVQADPALASAWYDLALVHQARGEPALARTAFQRFVATAGPEYAAEVAQVRALLARGGP